MKMLHPKTFNLAHRHQILTTSQGVLFVYMTIYMLELMLICRKNPENIRKHCLQTVFMHDQSFPTQWFRNSKTYVEKINK